MIVPGAREDTLGRWMPVVSVRSAPRDGRSAGATWPARTVVAERHKTRTEAQVRSVQLAKQMIDDGEFRSGDAIRERERE
jgi:hypothetical protein